MVFVSQKNLYNYVIFGIMNFVRHNLRRDCMATEKRCTCEDDFIRFFLLNSIVWNPLKYKSKEAMALDVWEELIKKEKKFFDKHKFWILCMIRKPELTQEKNQKEDQHL